MMNKYNQFHEVTISPWPILMSFQTMSAMMIFTSSLLMAQMSKTMVAMSVLMTITVAFKWWKNTQKESNKEGFHTKNIINLIKLGMIMFIASEVLFFTSFFWSYFHSSVSPAIEIGQLWPPNMIKGFNPINVPLLNTIILVSSGFSVTWAHHLILKQNLNKAKIATLITCLLGLYFSFLQAMEYLQSEFSLSDSSYGTTFFMATGFHGVHVLIGTSFLIVNLIFLNKTLISKSHHMGMELAAWYWHFVDVIWLFLYMSIYWWGK